MRRSRRPLRLPVYTETFSALSSKIIQFRSARKAELWLLQQLILHGQINLALLTN